jgi:hypothetical protein
MGCLDRQESVKATAATDSTVVLATPATQSRSMPRDLMMRGSWVVPVEMAARVGTVATERRERMRTAGTAAMEEVVGEEVTVDTVGMAIKEVSVETEEMATAPTVQVATAATVGMQLRVHQGAEAGERSGDGAH